MKSVDINQKRVNELRKKHRYQLIREMMHNSKLSITSVEYTKPPEYIPEEKEDTPSVEVETTPPTPQSQLKISYTFASLDSGKARISPRASESEKKKDYGLLDVINRYSKKKNYLTKKFAHKTVKEELRESDEQVMSSGTVRVKKSVLKNSSFVDNYLLSSNADTVKKRGSSIIMSKSQEVHGREKMLEQIGGRKRKERILFKNTDTQTEYPLSQLFIQNQNKTKHTKTNKSNN